jgi:hypothetical protein
MVAMVINGSFFGVLAIGFLIGAAATGFHGGGLIVVAVMLGIFSLMMWSVSWAGLRPVVLDRDELRVPLGFKRVIRIPLGQVTGIGLTIATASAKAGWALTVWAGNGRVVRSANISARGTAGALLASSQAGNVTQEMWSRIAGYQGPAGALLTQNAQRHPHMHGQITPLSVWDPSSGQIVDVNAITSVVEHLYHEDAESSALGARP